MASRRSCLLCGKSFHPDARHRRDQKYCRRCRKEAKREQDRLHKKQYRQTGLGKEQRKRESQKRRVRINWTTYMRFWRKADPKKRSHQERKAAKRYYQAHKAKILAKRRQQRAQKTCDQNSPSEACSH